MATPDDLRIDISSNDKYVENILRSCALTTIAHTIAGLGLARLFKGQEFKGWPLYTYWHSLLHTGVFKIIFYPPRRSSSR